MRNLLFLFSLSSLLLYIAPVKAQTLAEILEKHHEAIGQEKLAALKTYSLEAMVNQMGMELPMTVKVKRPDKFRMEMDIQGRKMVQAYDGESGWLIAPWLSPEPTVLSGDELRQARDQTNIDGPFYKLRERGLSAEFLGRDTMEGKECFNLKLIGKDGSEIFYFLDSETYYVLLAKRKVDVQGEVVDVETKMSNYQIKDGIAMAMEIESNSPMGTATIKINKVDYNVPVDDSIFENPAK